jgi:cell division protein FtsB
MKKTIIMILLILAVMSAAYVAADGQDSASVSKKLDEIRADQKVIMAGIADIKNELAIIKIRITQQQ